MTFPENILVLALVHASDSLKWARRPKCCCVLALARCRKGTVPAANEPA